MSKQTRTASFEIWGQPLPQTTHLVQKVPTLRIKETISMYNKNLIGWITLLAIVASENEVTGRRDLFQKEGKARQNSWKLLWQDEFEFFDRSKWEYQYEDGCGYGICRWGNNEEVSGFPCSELG